MEILHLKDLGIQQVSSRIICSSPRRAYNLNTNVHLGDIYPPMKFYSNVLTMLCHFKVCQTVWTDAQTHTHTQTDRPPQYDSFANRFVALLIMQLCGIKAIYLLVQFFGEDDLCIHLLEYFCIGVDVESPAERLVTLTVDKNGSCMMSSDDKYENQTQHGATYMEEIPLELPVPESPTSPESDTGPANTSDSFLNKSNTVFDFVDDEEVTEATKSEMGIYTIQGKKDIQDIDNARQL